MFSVPSLMYGLPPSQVRCPFKACVKFCKVTILDARVLVRVLCVFRKVYGHDFALYRDFLFLLLFVCMLASYTRMRSKYPASANSMDSNKKMLAA